MVVNEVESLDAMKECSETANAAEARSGGVGKRQETTSDGPLLDALRGVPRAALRAVLGKELGTRAWREARGGMADGSGSGVSDREIVEGLIGHLSRAAARTLREEGRMARSVSLYATYGDGTVRSGRRRLSRITQEAAEIFEESRMVYESLPKSAARVANLELRVASVVAEVLEVEPERAGSAWRMAEAVAAA